MLSIRTVLCPVDFSPATSHHVDVAVGICRAFGARLILHHNLVETGIGSAVGWMWAPAHPDAESAAAQKLRDLMAHLPEGTAADIRLTHGPVVDAVKSVGRSVEADLIVMSTRGGASGSDGSVTERVLKYGTLPIFVIHQQHERRVPQFVSDSTERQALLVPTDLTPASKPAMDVAFDLARQFPFDVHLLHVVPSEGRKADEARSHLATLAPADLPRPPEAHVETGSPARAIARVADEIAAACIVMGEREHAPLRHWFRPDTSQGVLHPTACPIWYVPGRLPLARAGVSALLGHAKGNDGAQVAAATAGLVDELRDTVFHYWPAFHLYGLVDSLEAAEQTLADLLAAGIQRRRLHTWYGTSASMTIDPSGTKRSMAARFWRTLEKATPERELLDRYAAEVERGRVCIGVRCSSSEARQVAAALLQKHGGHLISYFSVGAVEHLTA